MAGAFDAVNNEVGIVEMHTRYTISQRVACFQISSCSHSTRTSHELIWGQVVLCENQILNDREMADTITHELIHAYDHCRAKVDRILAIAIF